MHRDPADAVLEVALAALGAAAGVDPRELVAGPLLQALDADVITYNEVSPATRAATVPVVGPVWARSLAPPPEVAGPTLSAHPLVRHYAATATTAPLRVTDVVPTATWRRSAARSLVREVLGMQEQLAVPVDAPAGQVRAWVAMRAAGPFAAGAVQVAARVRPVLCAVEAQRQVLEGLSAALDVATGADASSGTAPTVPVQAPRDGGAGLTPREQAVLALLGQGLTAAAIGRRLTMSPRTVTTHLQHIYRKLDVCDRLGAVLRAQEHGLVPSPREAPHP